MALVSAGLFVAGSLLPYVSGGGVTISLVDSGGELHLLFLVPAAVAGIAALVGLTGNGLAATVAAGVVTGMVGPTISILTVFYKLVDQTSGGASLGVGFFIHLAAVTSALSAMGAAWGATRSTVEPPLNQALCTLAALAFVGVPASILLSKDGYSVLDIDDGMIKAGMIGWAVIAPAVAVMALLSRRRGSVALGAGVGIGHLGMVLFMLARDDGAEGLLAGFGVLYEGLHNASVAGAVVLSGLALALTGDEAPAAATSLACSRLGDGPLRAPPASLLGRPAVDVDGLRRRRGRRGPAGRHGAGRASLPSGTPEPAHGVVLHPVRPTPPRPTVSLAGRTAAAPALLPDSRRTLSSL